MTMKKVLFAVAAVAMLTMAAQAGEIKYHEWPVTFVPQEITTIPVTMDVGYWIRIKDQGDLKIKLGQQSIHTYYGCTNMVGNPVVPGDYSSSVSPANVDAPGGTVAVCAKLENADLSKVAGGTKNVHVANVTIKVVPRACP
jgi:hypothetical protein